MPSASAISVTLAPEASALAIRARRPSRRSSAVDKGWISVARVLRLLMRANRHEKTTYVISGSGVLDSQCPDCRPHSREYQRVTLVPGILTNPGFTLAANDSMRCSRITENFRPASGPCRLRPPVSKEHSSRQGRLKSASQCRWRSWLSFSFFL
jgi:hypothetical protein